MDGQALQTKLWGLLSQIRQKYHRRHFQSGNRINLFLFDIIKVRIVALQFLVISNVMLIPLRLNLYN